jgi:hypothetical protein
MKRALRMLGLTLAVTAGGLMVGAFLVSPLASETPWMQPALLAFAAIAVMSALVAWLKPARVATPLSGYTTSPGGARTPNTVHAMAASGSNAIEIARQTRMPIDAVALLLAMSTISRQLQPPPV